MPHFIQIVPSLNFVLIIALNNLRQGIIVQGRGGGGGGGGKSQYPYVGLNSSVTECPIEIILSGIHWFKEFVKSKNISVHFFQIKVHFAFI